MYNRVRHFVWVVVEAAGSGERISSAFDGVIISLILANVFAVILDSMPQVHAAMGSDLARFEAISVGVFTVEYLLRVWSCTADPRYAHPISGRLHFIVTPMAIVDLLAIAPFYLPAFLGGNGITPVLRLFRLAKIGRYYGSLAVVNEVFREKREELALTAVIMSVLLVVSSTMMYLVEHAAQPDVYSSVPATMWWAVATLTTVGYGDVTPVTAMGKVLASFISLLGIGMFALPTGILGAGFVEAMHRRRQRHVCCPHCGAALPSHFGR